MEKKKKKAQIWIVSNGRVGGSPDFGTPPYRMRTPQKIETHSFIFCLTRISINRLNINL